MTIKQVKTIHNFIMMFQNHWSIYIVVYMLLLVGGKTYELPGVHWLIWMGLGLLPYFFNKLKSICKYKVLRYLAYAMVLLAVYMIRFPYMTYTYIYLICVAYYCVNAEWYDWSKEDSTDYKPIPIALIMVMALVVVIIFQAVRLYEYQRTILYLVIWNVVLYFVASYVHKYVRFLDLNKHSIGYMPIKSVLSSGILSMLGFSSILSVLLVIVANVGQMGDVLQYIKKFIRAISSKVGKWLRDWIKDWLEKFNNEEMNIPDMGGTMSQVVLPAGEDKWTVLDVIISIVVLIVAVNLLYQLIRIVIVFLENYMRGSGDFETAKMKEDVHESSDVVEKIPGKRRESFFENMSPAQRIRRRFRRKILSEKENIQHVDKRERMELYTARECTEIIDISEVGRLYEKARYSPYECTAEDLRLMKNFCNRKNKE